MESSASSSTLSVRKFKALWKKIISYLSLTYAVLVVKPQVVSKVEKLIRKGRPDDLPSDHPFLADYEEFVIVFEHGVSQFQDNEKAIRAYFVMERFSESIKEESEHADVVYNTLCDVQGQLHFSREHLNKYREPIVERIRGTEKKLRRGVPCPEKDEIEMDLLMDSRCETFVNSVSTSLGRIAERLDELVESHLVVIRWLNKRLLNIDEMLPKLEEAKEQAEATNQRLEE